MKSPQSELAIQSNFLGTLLTHPTFLLILRVLIGGILMDAGTLKIRTPEAFGSILSSYHLLSPTLVTLLEFQLPWMEVLLGFLLIAGFPRRAPALGIAFLSLLFATVHGQALARGGAIDCGCLGAAHPMSPATGLLLSSILLLSSTWLYLVENYFARNFTTASIRDCTWSFS